MAQAVYATSCGVSRPGVSRSSAPTSATVTAADVPVDAPPGASEKIVRWIAMSSGTFIRRMAASSRGCFCQPVMLRSRT